MRLSCASGIQSQRQPQAPVLPASASRLRAPPLRSQEWLPFASAPVLARLFAPEGLPRVLRPVRTCNGAPTLCEARCAAQPSVDRGQIQPAECRCSAKILPLQHGVPPCAAESGLLRSRPCPAP